MEEDPTVFKKRKKDFKDIEPLKDPLQELSEEEPKNIHDIKKRLSKK
jgi:hypothetical protein